MRGGKQIAMRYEDDERTLTMAEIEEILADNFGDSNYNREAGCYIDGNWLSINSILDALSANC